LNGVSPGGLVIEVLAIERVDRCLTGVRDAYDVCFRAHDYLKCTVVERNKRLKRVFKSLHLRYL
jgi:hypothetical protein